MKGNARLPRDGRQPWAAPAVALAVIQSLGTGAVALAPVPSQAQNAEPSERIEITGSRVKRADAEGALPVTVIDRVELEASGQTTVAEFVHALTFSTAGNIRPRSGNSWQGFSGISLRGLGFQRTLVLVDGHRIAKSPITGDGVDMSSIPLAAVERIEILTDGASAIYGSDAIGGVVNVILRKSFEGVALMAGTTRVSGPEDGGDRQEASAILGISGEKGRVIMGASTTQRDIIFTRHGYGSAGSVGTSPFSNNYVRLSTRLFIAPVPGGCSNPNFFLRGGVCRYDFTRVAAEEAELGTKSFFARGEFNIARDWTAFMTTTVSRVTSFGRQAPVPGSVLIAPGSVAHPWHPAYPDIRLRELVAEDETILLDHRFAAGGTRDTDTEGNLYDTLLGVKGTFRGADIEVGLRKSTSRYVQIGRGFVIQSLARAEIYAGRYNIFDPISTPAHILSTFTATASRHGLFDHTEQYAQGTFDLFRLPGGKSRLFIGAERRKETYQDLYDSLSEGGVLLGSSGNSAQGSRKVASFGAELVMPISRQLEATVAARREKYSDYGSDLSPKASVRFQPTNKLLLRASVGEGFLAPPLPLLTTKPILSLAAITDERHCLADGYSETECEGVLRFQVNNLQISNPELDSEKAKQWSVGAVWDAMPALSLGVDIWNTRLEDAIVIIGPQAIVDRDNGRSPLPIPAGLSITRDPITGAILQIVSGATNEGILERRGIDASVLFAPTVGRFGSLRHRLTWSRMLRATSNGISLIGGFGFVKDRAQMSNIWGFRMLDAAWNVNLMGKHGDCDDKILGCVGSYVTHDVQLGWATRLQGLKLVIGALNVMGKMPPLDRSGGFTPWLYNGYGRQAYARVEMRF